MLKRVDYRHSSALSLKILFLHPCSYSAHPRWKAHSSRLVAINLHLSKTTQLIPRMSRKRKMKAVMIDGPIGLLKLFYNHREKFSEFIQKNSDIIYIVHSQITKLTVKFGALTLQSTLVSTLRCPKLLILEPSRLVLYGLCEHAHNMQ